MDKKISTKKKEKNPVVENIKGETIKGIAAYIRLGQSSDGNQAHYFSIARCWFRPGSDKPNYSERMYPRHAEAIAEVSLKAAKRCEELDAALDGSRDNIEWNEGQKDAA